MASLQSVNVDSVELSFVERGAGRSVIFIHGIPTDYRAWDAQVEALSKGFHTLSYSRRCAYPSKRKDFENSTIENNAKDLAGLIKTVDDGPVHLVGHSYGGFVAVYCAFQHPELVRSLVLAVPYIPTLLIRNLDSALDKFSLLVRKPSVALSAQKLLNNAVYPALKELDQGNGEKALRIHLDGLQQRQNAFDQFPEQVKSMLLDNKETIRELTTKLPPFTSEEARTVSAPTLLIRGDSCPKALCAIIELLAKSMRKSQSTTVSNCAHFPHFENPEEFNSKINEFLSKQTP
ncbi:MAG: alpha/beta hydrolase [Candidatus Bathyarchaeia archaeon]|jgi:pimeloyl-ACP methyl ester carboxylesterase